MARSLRIEYPGAIYHIMSRGNGQQDIYLEDSDRVVFLKTLAATIERFGWQCHAYCLMSNHYHLVIETPEPNLARGMRQLNGIYTQCFNRRHQCVGHLFQGRYKSILVERDAYLLTLSRYVVLNPVRAEMVKNVAQWNWSSYLATAGMVECPAWLNTDWLLSQFDALRSIGRDQYVHFVNDGINQSRIWKHLNQQIYLGGDAFVERIKSAIGDANDLAEMPNAQWKPSSQSLTKYADAYDDRTVAMAQAYLDGGYTMHEISKYFSVHYATVSRAVKKFEAENV